MMAIIVQLISAEVLNASKDTEHAVGYIIQNQRQFSNSFRHCFTCWLILWVSLHLALS